MKKIIFIYIIFKIFQAHAEDQWYCQDPQSGWQGNVISICGVASASSEGEARQKALNNAIYEFKTMCELSSDCKGHKVNIEPKRSTSFEDTSPNITSFQRHVSHRLFVFTIQ